MHLQLIKQIRTQLKINPNSKSTLVKKSELLQYARQIYQQNQKIKQTLNPPSLVEIDEYQQTLEQKNITLLTFQQYLREQKQKNEFLETSAREHKKYIDQANLMLSNYQKDIQAYNGKKTRDQHRKMELSSFQRLIHEEKSQQSGEGETAMLNLMKQFLELNQQQPNHDLSQIN